MVTQHVFERCLQKVNGRMVPSDGKAPLFIITGHRTGADRNRALCDNAAVQELSVSLFGIVNPNRKAVALNHTAVADLTAAFCIKRGLIQHEDNLVPLRCGICQNAVLSDAQNLCVNTFLLVAVKDSITGKNRKNIFFPCSVLHIAARLSGAAALHFHLFLKLRLVHGESFFTHNLTGQVDRESVGIIKLKCLLAGQFGFLLGL